jgi:hypothetical protein
MVQSIDRRAGRIVLLVAGAWLLFQLANAIWLFGRHDWASIAFPYPLDYGEGPLLDQAIGLARFENIYRPDLSTPPFTIANYPPLFPVVQAPFVAIFGPAFWYGRAIATLSVVASALFIGLTLHTLTRDPIAAVTGGLTLLAFPYIVHWSSFNRVDSLALGLSTAALFVTVRWSQRRAGLVAAALLLVAAIYTRQSYALAAPLAACIYLLREQPRRRAFELTGMVVGASLLLLGLLQLLTGGGFFFHIVIANVNPFHWSNVINYARPMVENLWPLLAAAGLFLLAGSWLRPPSWWLIGPYLLGALASAITIGKAGSNINYLFELCAALSLAVGALIAWAGRSALLRAALLLGLAFQVAGMVAWSHEDYEGRVMSKIGQRDQISRMFEIARSADGPVLADEYMGLVPLAGKRLQYQPFEFKQLAEDGIWDERPFAQLLDEHAFPIILIYDSQDWDSFGERWTGRQQLYITTEYQPAERVADTLVYEPNE